MDGQLDSIFPLLLVISIFFGFFFSVALLYGISEYISVDMCICITFSLLFLFLNSFQLSSAQPVHIKHSSLLSSDGVLSKIISFTVAVIINISISVLWFIFGCHRSDIIFLYHKNVAFVRFHFFFFHFALRSIFNFTSDNIIISFRCVTITDQSRTCNIVNLPL